MTDLQKTIEELKKLHEKLPPEKWIAEFKQDIEDYPPAVIERDGETKKTIGEHWDSEICTARHARFGEMEFIVALRNAFPAIVEALESRWIPVSEPPKRDMACLAVMERSGRKFVDVADYFVDGGWQRAGCAVTDWQPLPDLPLVPKASE